MLRQSAFTGDRPLLKGALHCHTTRSDGKGTPEEVIRLQEMLRDLGYYSGSIRSGQFGSVTGSAVAKFQKANGLKATQVADSETLARIEEAWKALGLETPEAEEAQAGH